MFPRSLYQRMSRGSVETLGKAAVASSTAAPTAAPTPLPPLAVSMGRSCAEGLLREQAASGVQYVGEPFTRHWGIDQVT
jgi:hypothetical protein